MVIKWIVNGDLQLIQFNLTLGKGPKFFGLHYISLPENLFTIKTKLHSIYESYQTCTVHARQLQGEND